MVWVECPRPYCGQDRALVILAVRAVTGVDQQQGGALGDVQVGVVLVSEVCLQSSHGGTLVVVADGDELVRVCPAPCRLSHYLTKFTELLSNLTEGLRVQV